MEFVVEDIGDDPAVRALILALNNEHARETSLLGLAELDRMIAAASMATVIPPHAAFLLVFDESANYNSPNFLWFRERFDSFLYIDRVVVGAAYRRLGLGRILYDDLFRRAGRLGRRRIACEVNLRPPNPVSDAFHAKLGFAEIGQSIAGDSGKLVRYLMRDVYCGPNAN